VRSLRFVGNREYSAAVLATTVATLPSSMAGVPLLGTRRCLDPVEFARDLRRIETLYRRRGYPDVKVDTVVRMVRPLVIDITFRIAEGEPMRVSAFALRGVQEEAALAGAARDFPLRVGGLFDRSALEAGRDTLVRRLRNLGWPQAEALLAYTTNTAQRTANVEVTVVPGARARIGRIALQVDSGTSRSVSDGTIRRTMALRTGDWYSARQIIDAQRNLYQTDAFQRVELQPDSLQPAGDTIVNLTARLVEGDRFAARGGLGWATLDCFRMQGTLTDRDFLPYAQRLELTARVSKIGLGAPLDGAEALCQAQARSDPYSRTLNYYTSMTLRQPVRAKAVAGRRGDRPLRRQTKAPPGRQAPRRLRGRPWRQRAHAFERPRPHLHAHGRSQAPPLGAPRSTKKTLVLSGLKSNNACLACTEISFT
jgi:outer membrane protein insertion porin family/translocation and assembly module TamA